MKSLQSKIECMLTRKSWIALGIGGLVISPLFQSEVAGQIQEREQIMEHLTFYRTTQFDGLSIFYREAGPKDGPTLLLLSLTWSSRPSAVLSTNIT